MTLATWSQPYLSQFADGCKDTNDYSRVGVWVFQLEDQGLQKEKVTCVKVSLNTLCPSDHFKFHNQKNISLWASAIKMVIDLKKR